MTTPSDALEALPSKIEEADALRLELTKLRADVAIRNYQDEERRFLDKYQIDGSKGDAADLSTMTVKRGAR